MIKQLVNIFTKQQMSVKMIKASKLKRILLNVAAVALVLFIFGSMLMPVYLHADEIKQSLSFIKLGNIIMLLCFSAIFLLSLLSAVGFLYSSGYLDTNLNNYFVLPIKRRDLIVAKLVFTYKNVMILTGLVIVPFIILYILLEQITVYFIVATLLGVFLIPLFNVGIAMLLVGTLMFFVNKMKNKALAKNIIYVAFFLVAFGIYMAFIFGMSGMGGEGESPAAMMMVFNDLLAKLKIVFFIPNMFSGIMMNKSFFNLIYIIIALVILCLVYLYFEKIYLKGALGFNEGGSSVKKKNKQIKSLNRHSMVSWYFLREFKELTKTGVYFFNTLFSNILIVVIYLAMMGYAYFSGLESQNLIAELLNYLDVYVIIIITGCIGTFFALFNMGAATAFSRDAKYLEFISAMPINQVKAFLGKVLFHALVEFLTLFIFMVIPMLVLQVDIILIIVSVLVMMLIVLGTLLMPIIIDLNFPSLEWESESALVKRSKSLMLSMLASLILDVVFFGGGFILATVFDFDYKGLAIAIVVFYAILFILLLFVYRKSVLKAFRKIKM